MYIIQIIYVIKFYKYFFLLTVYEIMFPFNYESSEEDSDSLSVTDNSYNIYPNDKEDEIQSMDMISVDRLPTPENIEDAIYKRKYIKYKKKLQSLRTNLNNDPTLLENNTRGEKNTDYSMYKTKYMKYRSKLESLYKTYEIDTDADVKYGGAFGSIDDINTDEDRFDAILEKHIRNEK